MTVWFYKKRGKWRYEFFRDHKPFRGYCVHPKTGEPARNKREALAFETAVKGIVTAQTSDTETASAPARATYTVVQMITAYAATARRHKSWTEIQRYCRELIAYFEPDTDANSIDDARVWEYIAWSREQPKRVWIGGPRKRRIGSNSPWKKTTALRSDATINNYLVALRRAFNLAHKARDRSTQARTVPNPPEIPYLEVTEHQPRPVGDADLRRIMDAAGARFPHLRDLVALVAHSGLRVGEALSLTRAQIDYEARGIWLQDTKGKRNEFLPLNAPAMTLVERLDREAVKADATHLILYRHKGSGKPRPIKSVGNAWSRILRELGLDDRHTFHNTRASYVTGLAMAGVAGPVIQKLARHVSFSTTQRYLEVVDQAKRDAVDRIASRAATAGLDLGASTVVALPDKNKGRPRSAHQSRTKVPHARNARARSTA
jgi:integrase